MADPSRPSTPTRLLVVGLTILGVVVLSATGSAALWAPLEDAFSRDVAGDRSSGEAHTATEAPPPDARAGGTSAETPTPVTPTASPTPTATATPTSDAGGARRYRYTLREGANETTVHVYDSGRPGPTVVVVGGQHGNEPAGYRTAADVADWEVERGVLVVVPRANPRAARNGTRKVDGRDLNAQFPVGERPTSAQASAVWSVLERHDADVVVDLHSSVGIYGVDGGVGQAVFPTVTGDAVENADAAIARVNREYDLEGNRSFRRGNVMGRSGMSLTRKVAGDLNQTAYIVETTKQDTDLQTRVTWTKAVAWELLWLHGLVSADRPPAGRANRTSKRRPDSVA